MPGGRRAPDAAAPDRQPLAKEWKCGPAGVFNRSRSERYRLLNHVTEAGRIGKGTRDSQQYAEMPDSLDDYKSGDSTRSDMAAGLRLGAESDASFLLSFQQRTVTRGSRHSKKRPLPSAGRVRTRQN